MKTKRKRKKKYDPRTGLVEIASGSVGDAVKLLFAGDVTDEMIEASDLACLESVKVQKDGGMEMKFVDRIKALQVLCALPADDGEGMKALLAALSGDDKA